MSWKLRWAGHNRGKVRVYREDGSYFYGDPSKYPRRLILSGYKLRPRSEFMMEQCKKGSGICVTKFGQFKSAWDMLTAPNWMYTRENSNPFKKCGINRWSDSDTRY